jgi:hypothetical protein
MGMLLGIASGACKPSGTKPHLNAWQSEWSANGGTGLDWANDPEMCRMSIIFCIGQWGLQIIRGQAEFWETDGEGSTEFRGFITGNKWPELQALVVATEDPQRHSVCLLLQAYFSPCNPTLQNSEVQPYGAVCSFPNTPFSFTPPSIYSHSFLCMECSQTKPPFLHTLL